MTAFQTVSLAATLAIDGAAASRSATLAAVGSGVRPGRGRDGLARVGRTEGRTGRRAGGRTDGWPNKQEAVAHELV